LSFFANVSSKLRVIPKGSQNLYQWYLLYVGFVYFMVLRAVSYFNVSTDEGSVYFFFLRCNSPTRAQVASYLRFRDQTQIHHTLQDSSGRRIGPS